jgi:flagellin-like protein
MFRNDEGIGPVWGVVMMIAITVILAAVIAMFVFGMLGSLNAPKYDKTITVGKITETHAALGNGLSKIQNGVIDTDGNGYIINQIQWGQSISPVVNGTYNISYYIDSTSTTRVIVKMEPISIPQDPSLAQYQCLIGSDGVCK